jgi:hypothetical protein
MDFAFFFFWVHQYMIDSNLPSDFGCHSFFFHTACRALGGGLMVSFKETTGAV